MERPVDFSLRHINEGPGISGKKSSADRLLDSFLSRVDRKYSGNELSLSEIGKKKFREIRDQTKHLSGAEIARVRRACLLALCRRFPYLSSFTEIECKDGTVVFCHYLKRALAADSSFFAAFFYDRKKKPYSLPECSKRDLEDLIRCYTDENYFPIAFRSLELMKTMNFLLLYPDAHSAAIAREIDRWDPAFPKEREIGMMFIKETHRFALPMICLQATERFVMRTIRTIRPSTRCDYVEALRLLCFLERLPAKKILNDPSIRDFLDCCNRGYFNPILNPGIGCLKNPTGDLPVLKNVKYFGIREMHVTSETLRLISLCYLNLEILYLEETSVEREALEFLSSFPKLRRLSLKNCSGIDDFSVDCIFDRCPRLIELNLSGTAITDEALKRIDRFSDLRELHVSKCENLTSAAADYLADLKNLTVLSIADSSWFVDRGAETISRLYLLEILNVSGCENLTEGALEFILSMLSLRELNLRNSAWLTDRAMRIFFQQPVRMRLRRVELRRDGEEPTLLKRIVETMFGGFRFTGSE